MKKYAKLLLLVLGVSAFLASCQCRTCKKQGELTYTFCKDQGSQQDYDNTIAIYQNFGWTCQ